MAHPAPDRARDGDIAVDLEALDQFAMAMVTGVQGNILPNADRLASTFGAGVQFGANNPSVDVQALVSKYHQCLQAINDQLYTYGVYARSLIETARQISLNYRNADALAKATTQNLLAQMAQADITAMTPDLIPRFE